MMITKNDNFSPDRVCSVHDSSNVQSIAYDFLRQILRIEFNNASYDYTPVLPDQFGALVCAESVGISTNVWIRRASPEGIKVT